MPPKKKKAEDEAPDWKNSDAKKMLRTMLEDDQIPESMAPREVYDKKSVLFKEFPYKNFVTNLRNLRKAVRHSKDSAAFDSRALQNDNRLYPTAAITARGHPPWHGPEAERLLNEDFEKGLEELMAPKDLWLSRSKYQFFPLDVFCGHIYQVVYGRKERPYWLNEKKESRK